MDRKWFQRWHFVDVSTTVCVRFRYLILLLLQNGSSSPSHDAECFYSIWIICQPHTLIRCTLSLKSFRCSLIDFTIDNIIKNISFVFLLQIFTYIFVHWNIVTWLLLLLLWLLKTIVIDYKNKIRHLLVDSVVNNRNLTKTFSSNSSSLYLHVHSILCIYLIV